MKLLIPIFLLISFQVFCQTAEDYLKSGPNKLRMKDYPTAIEYYNKAIIGHKKRNGHL